MLCGRVPSFRILNQRTTVMKLDMNAIPFEATPMRPF